MTFTPLERYEFSVFDNTIFWFAAKINFSTVVALSRKPPELIFPKTNRICKSFQAAIITRSIVGLDQSRLVLCWYNKAIVH